MTKRTDGFTVIELLFIIVLIGFASVLFYVQKQNIEASARDDKKKIAINAMYYSLEEVFYPAHKYYPQTINSEILPSVDPDLFKDPNNLTINTAGSAYKYSPTNCSDNKCKSYTLKASLEKEADYTKTNKNK